MLVIQRRIGERFTIGDDIAVTVSKIIGKSVLIGADLPKKQTLSVTVKPGQTCVARRGIMVKVIKIKGGVVHFGITAPPDVRIVRDDAIDKEPKQSEATDG